MPPPDECRPKIATELMGKTPAKWVEPAPPVTLQIPSQYTGVIAAAVFFELLWIAPYAAIVVAAVSLLIFVAAIFWSAVRHQQRGWWLGLLFCLLLLTMPLWVGLANTLFARYLH